MRVGGMTAPVMKGSRYIIVIGLLGFLLVVSLLLNWFLFRQGKWYYMQLNAVRLDPLGLGLHSTEAGGFSDPGVRTVVFFGDSRAANWPAPDMDEYLFVNRGIGGETSAQTALRLEHHLQPLHPDMVVLQTGINDLKAIPILLEEKAAIIANCEANIEEIVTRSREMGALVVVTTLFPLGEVPLERQPFWSPDVEEAIGEVNAHIRALSTTEGVYVFDSYALLVKSDGKIEPEYSLDLLHLNAAGYERLNEALIDFLTDLE